MIKLLDKTTIDKIAAGEVIERPLSVVKELLDNSIDAGSTAITVEIREGGMSFIRVTDNGVGIPKDQVKTAYLRHATSKISDARDLNAITTLGFRGEALSTIAAVSQTEMITKTADSLTGVKYVIHGGEEIEFSEVGVPDGTTIVSRNLFYNTPARKKFLKSAMTEGSYISDLVQKIALSHPSISFKLIINNQTKIDTSGNGSVKDTIYQLFGRDITNNLIPVNYESEEIKLTGYIGKPNINRGNRGLENYFINTRYIKSGIINRAIEEGYKTFTMQHQFPFTVLYFELKPEKCDVNVHPTKMEFKYANERELFEVITRTVREALNHREIIPKQITPDKKEEAAIKPKPAEPFEAARRNVEATASKAPEQLKPNFNKAVSKPVEQINTGNIPKPNTKANNYSPSYKILESLKAGNEGLYDKSEDNAALKLVNDSDVVYEASNGKVTSANEASKEADVKDIANIDNNISDKKSDADNTETKNIAPAMKSKLDAYNNFSTETLKEIKGEQASLFDDDFLTEKARKKHRLIGQVFGTYWLIQYEDNLYIMDQHAAHEKIKYEELMSNLDLNNVMSQNLMPPMVITVSYAERETILNNFDLFMKIGYDIEEFGGNEFKINAVPSNLYGLHGRQMFMEFVSSLMENAGYMSNDIFIRKLSTMACKAAIKGNSTITATEAEALIDKLLSLENPYTCPHGRPTIISISEYELEKKFKRQV